MPKLIRIAALAMLAVALCDFDSAEIGAYRGEPVAAALAKFGRPIETALVEGDKVYFWRVHLNSGRNLCTIWGAARRGVMLNWGWQSCAY